MITQHTLLEYLDAKSDKFYIAQVSTNGSCFDVEVRWGRIGYKGQSKLYLERVSHSEALTKYTALIAAKKKKGYEVMENESTPIPAPAPKLPQNTSSYLVNRWVSDRTLELMDENFEVQGEFPINDAVFKAKPAVMQKVIIDNDKQTVFSC